MVSGRVAWVQFNGPPEFLPRGLQIPVEPIQHECKRVVRFAERAIQFQGFDRRSLRLRKCLLWRHHCILPVSRQSISVGQAGISLGIFRVLFDGLIEIGQGNPQTFRRSFIPEVAPFEIRLVRLRINNLCVF